MRKIIFLCACTLTGCATTFTTSHVEVVTPEGTASHDLEVVWTVKGKNVTTNSKDGSDRSEHKISEFSTLTTEGVTAENEGYVWRWTK